MDYTIREVPEAVDVALRAQAEAEAKSLEEVSLEALREKSGVSSDRPRRNFNYLTKMDDETYAAIRSVRAESERIWPDNYDR